MQGTAQAGGLPLTEYGLIGDCRTAGLVSRGGSLDWWCAPRFDSPSTFAHLLDDQRGGRFVVEAIGAEPSMSYEPGTNVLRRAWDGPTGRAQAWDFMPWPPPGNAPGPVVVRLLEGARGALDFRTLFAPRTDYARKIPRITRVHEGIAAHGSASTVLLRADRPLTPLDGGAEAHFSLTAGERAAFVLQYEPGLSLAEGRDPREAWTWMSETLRAWREWDARTLYSGPFTEAVRRSALALKLLQHERTGAIIAAPTTSLPEDPGGVRNWDYRYVWLRDAWLLAEALFVVGHTNQANGLLRWLLDTCGRGAPDLRVMYPIKPDVSLAEVELPHLAGWRGSRPVRIGNAAADQLQLDIYGELAGGLFRCKLLGRDTHQLAWPFLREAIDFVAKNWRQPDRGIWEFRAAPRHFVHSKVFAWVALDRGVRAAREGNLEAPLAAWEAEREAVRAEVLDRGWNEARGSFVQSYDSTALDAANLLIPIVGFLPADDPRVVATAQRIQEELSEGPFLLRYRADDGLPGREGAFLYCSFWMVDNLALQGRVREARALFERLISCAGPLGLLAEQVDAGTGELLGNYPQGFSHIGLIRSALLLESAERMQAPVAMLARGGLAAPGSASAADPPG